MLGGLWELPSVPGGDPDALAASLRERTGLRTRVVEALGNVRHAFTHRVLTLEIVRLERTGGRLRARECEPARWCAPASLAELPLSTLARKSLRAAGYA
jgi:adenine-specific DNA glycosylase